MTYTAYKKNLYWIKPPPKNSWCILGIPPDWDGETEDDLEPYVIRDKIIGIMVAETDHPRQINVGVIRESTDENNNN